VNPGTAVARGALGLTGLTGLAGELAGAGAPEHASPDSATITHKTAAAIRRLIGLPRHVA
jgi:hypothetical protein